METTIKLPISDIGYQGRTLDAFIDELSSSGTRILADIRLNPVSRKRGFSKRQLAEALAKTGIEYWHLPELGNPKWNRAGFSGSCFELRRARHLYSCMMAGDSAQARLDEVVVAAQDGLVTLMCFEASQDACHRYVVLQELHRRLELAGAVARKA